MSPRVPSSAALSNATPRWPSVLLTAATASALFPLVFAIAFYGEYLLAWLQLGHAPLPSLNDPKGIHPWLHIVVSVLFLCLPGALLVSLMTSIGVILLKLETTVRHAARVGATLALWVLLCTLLRSDPWRVVDWWMD